jgi:hypothetical protein
MAIDHAMNCLGVGTRDSGIRVPGKEPKCRGKPCVSADPRHQEHNLFAANYSDR